MSVLLFIVGVKHRSHPSRFDMVVVDVAFIIDIALLLGRFHQDDDALEAYVAPVAARVLPPEQFGQVMLIRRKRRVIVPSPVR